MLDGRGRKTHRDTDKTNGGLRVAYGARAQEREHDAGYTNPVDLSLYFEQPEGPRTTSKFITKSGGAARLR